MINFFRGKSIVEFFEISNLNRFLSPIFERNQNFENFENLLIVDFKCAKFQRYQRTFLRALGRSVTDLLITFEIRYGLILDRNTMKLFFLTKKYKGISLKFDLGSF